MLAQAAMPVVIVPDETINPGSGNADGRRSS